MTRVVDSQESPAGDSCGRGCVYPPPNLPTSRDRLLQRGLLEKC